MKDSPTRPAGWAGFFGNWQTIGRRLPLLTTVLLTVAVATIAGTAYFEMKRVLVVAAGEHLLGVSQQIASTFAKSEERLERDGTPLSQDPLVRMVLLRRDTATLSAARAHLVARSAAGQNMTVELWDTRGNLILAAGPVIGRLLPLGSFTSAVGPLIALHDTIRSQVQVPILDEKKDTIGIMREIAQVSSAQTKAFLAGLIGGQGVALVGNASGDVWTDLDKRVEGPGAIPKMGVATHTVRGGTASIGVLSAVAGTPWRVWVARPEADVIEKARAFFLRMLVVAVLVIGLGAIGARFMTRHVIRPLAELTRAAESLADGQYSRRAQIVRSDEVGRLAQAFNQMASAIEAALADLETQQVELETQQTELQAANEELRQTVAEVTAARQAEERSSARSAAIVAGAIDAMITIDEDERVVEFNPAAERLFGYAAADVRGKAIHGLITPPARNAAKANGGSAAQSLVGDGTSPNGRRIELSATRSDGTDFFVELATTRISVAGAPMFTCFVRDLTERKQFEAQLQQAQKMEAVGRLAGGVAHDFNNMLTVMVSYTDLVLADPHITDANRGDLTQVRAAADRAAVLTRQLLAFSRKQVLHPGILDINAVVGDVITMLARVMPENIRITSTLGSSLNTVFVDRGQLEQVIMNLAVNARDAMPAGGSLAIETWNEALDEAYVAMHAGGSTGQHVVLSVRDTGIGMDAKIREKIFEPFFTTKAAGKGTGLGLATVYGIVRQSGGSIYVYSEPGQGTAFKVYFPAHAGVVTAAEAAGKADTEPSRQLTVLLVEDDPAVRDATKMVLTRLGHHVVSAPDAGTALDLVRGNVDLFDVVLTDAVMPGRSGLELAEIVRRECPDLPVIVMSGYAEETINYDDARMSGVVFLEKPFTASIIARALVDASAGRSSV